MSLEVLRNELEDLLAGRTSVLEPLLFECLPRLVEVLLRLTLDLLPATARLLDAAVGLCVGHVDEVDPGPGIDSTLKISLIELPLPLLEKRINARRGVLRLAGVWGSEIVGKPRVKFDRRARTGRVERHPADGRRRHWRRPRCWRQGRRGCCGRRRLRSHLRGCRHRRNRGSLRSVGRLGLCSGGSRHRSRRNGSLHRRSGGLRGRVWPFRGLLEHLELEFGLGFGRERLRSELESPLEQRELRVRRIEVLCQLEEAPRLFGEAGVERLANPLDVSLDLAACTHPALNLPGQLPRLSVTRQIAQDSLDEGQCALEIALGEGLPRFRHRRIDVHVTACGDLANQLREIDRCTGGDCLLQALGRGEARVDVGDGTQNGSRLLAVPFAVQANCLLEGSEDALLHGLIEVRIARVPHPLMLPPWRGAVNAGANRGRGACGTGASVRDRAPARPGTCCRRRSPRPSRCTPARKAHAPA